MLIKIEDKNSLKISKRILESKEAWIWVGFGFGPRDNNNERIEETRELMKKYYSYVPYGMKIGNKNEEGETISIKDDDDDGYYKIDLNWWPAGVYRLNIYADKNRETKWGQLFNNDFNKEEKEEIDNFAHKEENGGGYSLRILIKPDRRVEPFGDKL